MPKEILQPDSLLTGDDAFHDLVWRLERQHLIPKDSNALRKAEGKEQTAILGAFTTAELMQAAVDKGQEPPDALILLASGYLADASNMHDDVRSAVEKILEPYRHFLPESKD